MEDLMSRAAYLKGLADGMKIDTKSDEGKLLSSILDLLGDMAEKINDIDDEQGFLADEIDDMGEAMEILGEEVFGCDDDEGVYQIICDNCGEEITFTDEDLDDLEDGSFACPNCGEIIELEFDDCGCDCGCEDHHHE